MLLSIHPLFSQTNHWLIQESPASERLNRIVFQEDTLGWIVGKGGTILHSSDRGNSWQFQQSGIDNEIFDIFMLDAQYGWAVALQPPSGGKFGTNILKTSNGGEDWQSRFIPQNYYFSIYFADTLHGFLGGVGGDFIETFDGGAQWTPANVDSNVFAVNDIFRFSFYSGDYGYAMGGSFDIAGAVWRTTNGGDLWTPIGVSPEPIRDMHFIDSLNIIAVGGDFDFGSGLIKTTDGGINWEYIYLGIFGEARGLGVRSASEYWSPLGFTGTIMTSDDAGENWISLPLPDYNPMYDIIFLDPETGLMVGENGRILRYSETPVSISSEEELPGTFALLPNYPNPFNPTTTISFRLPRESLVTIAVYDISGKLVQRITENRFSAGTHQLIFDGSTLASGIYFYHLEASAAGSGKRLFHARRKMILLK